MFQGDWGCATTSFLHRIRIHALLADLRGIQYNEGYCYNDYNRNMQPSNSEWK